MDTESTLVTTRRALHGVAELLLAGPQHRQSETIRLRPKPGGFGTITTPSLHIEGTNLMAGEVAIPLNGTTYREAASAAGVEPGAPEGLYKDGSGAHVDAVIDLDAKAAEQIAQAFAWGDEALRRLAADLTPVLWPEHFDLGITVDEVNYGVSPGDDYLGEPYAYVGPWQPRVGTFWNAPFGATRPLHAIPGSTALYDFFMEGQTRVTSDPRREP
ncbi:hypothetical protein J4573_28530 [Actinomadura barringtoniae]|uniref:Uncharacterized protein n=1 Tax=Actinomadura barringtoniae TaxID=1427535 RepID=A0A939PEE7_9ACTN|nr:hypothetical protein [Actinomadura barringtoniae]MBO2451076.1 hypothetical protein [Actinomadura barringtoniae]